jgi:hypothetical protein
MMKTPTEFELQHVLAELYDPAKAHAYYEKHKHLKGRNRRSALAAVARARSAGSVHGPRPTHVKASGAKARQRKELKARIQSLSIKLAQLEALIRKKEHAEKSVDRKSTAKKERAAKEKDKPKSAAAKAKAARENKKYRDKNQQKVKTASRKAFDKASSKSGGKSASSAKKAKTELADLKTLATKVKGQIAVAKHKLAAL